jgi:plasmid stabilization system protein ParE
MKVEYSKRAVSDLHEIATYFATSDNPRVGARILARIEQAVARIAGSPESGRPVVQRPGVRVVSLLPFRYNLFYAIRGDDIRILHIRHTSRRPWPGG